MIKLFDAVGLLLALAGIITLAMAKTSVGETQALILWLIAAVLLVGAALLDAMERLIAGSKRP